MSYLSRRTEAPLWGLSNATMERDGLADRLPITTIRLAPGHGPVVSDQLTVSNGIIGLIAAASQTQNDLIDLNVVPERNTAAIDNAAKAMKGFKATIQVLYKVLRQFELNKLPNPTRAGFLELDLLIGVLTKSAVVISDLGNRLLEISDESNLLSVSSTVLCARHGDSIIEDANRVRKAEAVLTKIASVLQVSVTCIALHVFVLLKIRVGAQNSRLFATATRLMSSSRASSSPISSSWTECNRCGMSSARVLSFPERG